MTPRYLTTAQCATYIGRSVKAVYHLVAASQIPHLRVGRRVQFDKEKVDRWLDRHSVRGSGV